jgi:hypothetical protein
MKIQPVETRFIASLNKGGDADLSRLFAREETRIYCVSLQGRRRGFIASLYKGGDAIYRVSLQGRRRGFIASLYKGGDADLSRLFTREETRIYRVSLQGR